MRSAISLSLLVLLTSCIVACCGVGRPGKPIVNADQSVIIIWDAAKQQQHFIRKASFATKDDDFGFIIPSPTEPSLGEASDEAFQYLMTLTAPPIVRSSGSGCGCGGDVKSAVAGRADVTVLQQKNVAGYDATVLEAKTGKALTEWLAKHGYHYSPEVAAWAQPYIDQGWKFTALKISASGQDQSLKVAKALRMSFTTQKPLFPYREPASATMAQTLGQTKRLLRIYFLAETRYEGTLADARNTSWEGAAMWAGKLNASEVQQLRNHLKLEESQLPTTLYLTEFEDNWKYREAESDLYFAQAKQQGEIRRVALQVGEDQQTGVLMTLAIVLLLCIPTWRRGHLRDSTSA